MFNRSAILTAAWKAYRVARPCFFATGDETGSRRFLRDLFGKMLTKAWADAKKAAQHADHQATVRAFVEAQRRVAIAKASAMEPGARNARIAAIRDDIEILQYAPLGVRVSQKRAALTDEFSALTVV